MKQFQTVQHDQAQQYIQSGEYTVLDVRTPDEFETGHIPGALNIPVQVLPFELGKLNSNEKYIVICLGGGRSEVASGILSANGFEHIINCAQGMNSWPYEQE